MKKLIIPLLATTMLSGGLAFAATNGSGPGMPGKEDRMQHRAEMCSNIVAHETGKLAFLETKLSLSSSQAGAFNAWKSVKLSEAKAHSAKCSTMAMPDRDHPPSPVEGLAREEQMLKQRLADLQTERPALTALYNSLNDTQRKEFAMAGMRMHGEHGGMMGHGFGRGHHGPMGHGPGGPGEMGPHDGGPDMNDGDGPPPPPPQGQ